MQLQWHLNVIHRLLFTAAEVKQKENHTPLISQSIMPSAVGTVVYLSLLYHRALRSVGVLFCLFLNLCLVHLYEDDVL